MLEILLQMAALIVCGTLWRVAKPDGMDADATRRPLTSLVYYLLLPALVLDVLWRAPPTLDTPRIALVAALVVPARYQHNITQPVYAATLVWIARCFFRSIIGGWGAGAEYRARTMRRFQSKHDFCYTVMYEQLLEPCRRQDE